MRAVGLSALFRNRDPCEYAPRWRLRAGVGVFQAQADPAPLVGRHLRHLRIRARKLPVQTVPPHRAATPVPQPDFPRSRHHVTSGRPTS